MASIFQPPSGTKGVPRSGGGCLLHTRKIRGIPLDGGYRVNCKYFLLFCVDKLVEL